jgi:hypothetical protein
MGRVLDVDYFHVVFTLPAALRPLALADRRRVFALLLRAAAQTLLTLGRDPKRLGAELGITTVLHTWTRELEFHPHVHCIVTAGGLSLDGARWVERTRFLFPGDRMKAVFRGRILAGLERLRAEPRLALDERAWRALLHGLPPKRKWVVYAEAPFGRSTHVLRYLGRYTHRVAISDSRLVSIDERGVTFRTRGDAETTLPPEEFLRRFLLHVLPRGFHKIRHFGLYGGQAVKGRLAVARRLVGEGDRDAALLDEEPPDPEDLDGWADLILRLTGEDPLTCPICGRGRLVARPLPRGPP